MEITTLALFVLTFGSILVLPGPNSAYAVGQSLKYGVVSSLVVPMGFMSATGLHAILVFSGLGVIVHEYSLIMSVLKWLGIAYLLWLSYKSFKSKPSNLPVSRQEAPKLKMYFSAMFVSLTNPKALLGSLMVYPLFVDSQAAYFTQAVLLSATAMSVSFLVYSSYSLGASALKGRLVGSKCANKIVGGMYLGASEALAVK